MPTTLPVTGGTAGQTSSEVFTVQPGTTGKIIINTVTGFIGVIAGKLSGRGADTPSRITFAENIGPTDTIGGGATAGDIDGSTPNVTGALAGRLFILAFGAGQTTHSPVSPAVLN